jgi:hypothetical protein
MFGNAGFAETDRVRERTMKRQCTLEEIHAEMQRRIEADKWALGYSL